MSDPAPRRIHLQLVRGEGVRSRAAQRADDGPGVPLELGRAAPFCANPRCALHVRLDDAQVEGDGDWVVLPDGRIFGRSRWGGALLCDACVTQRGPVRLGAHAV